MRNMFGFSFALSIPFTAIVTSALAQAGAGGERYFHGPWMMEWGGGWAMLFLGPLFMIATVAALVATIVLVLRWLGLAGQSGAAPASRTPLDILRERYAKGEIDKSEFEERRRVLGA